MTQHFGDFTILALLLVTSLGTSLLFTLIRNKVFHTFSESLPEPMRETLMRDLFQVKDAGQKPQLNFEFICRIVFKALILFVVLSLVLLAIISLSKLFALS